MGNQVVVQEKPVREQIREQKRAIDKSIRNIEREKRRVEAEEKKIKGEIKKMAKAGQHVRIHNQRKQQKCWQEIL